MPRYNMTLEVEVVCPVDPRDPTLTITPEEILKNIITPPNRGGYALCVKGNGNKMTGDVMIRKAWFRDHVCEHCGTTISAPKVDSYEA